MKFSEKCILGFRLLLPSPFSIAICLTILTICLAYTLTPPQQNTMPHILQIGLYWQQGFWDLLAFTMQMMLILVLGHALARSPFVGKIIANIAAICTTTQTAALLVCLTTMIFGYLNWGLGLIIGAVMARTIGDQALKQNKAINYPLIGAAGYLGMLIWHGGLSGSATLTVASQDHFLMGQMGILPVTDTIFSQMNIVINLVLLVLLPLLFYCIGKYSQQKAIPLLPANEDTPHHTKETTIGAEKLDTSRWFGKLFAFFMLTQAVVLYYQLSQQNPASNILTLNFINYLLFTLGLLSFRSIQCYMQALEEAISGSLGILIQFPLYAGIAGIIQHSGLIHIFSDFIVQTATSQSYPLFVMLSSALVNIFVPSGGGQWAVQGPILVEAANHLNVSYAKGVMAFAYGDQLTNMLQPFWALPLLGITRLKAYQVLPYTVLAMLLAGFVFAVGLWIYA